MTISLAQINAHIENQMAQFRDPIVRDAMQSLLIEPVLQQRYWAYNNNTDAVWAIAEDPESDTCYVYCEVVWDDEYELLPWGIVLITRFDLRMDSYWSRSLERVFYDSWACMRLPIWNIIKRDAQGGEQIIESALTNRDAEKIVNMLNVEHGIQHNSRTVYDIKPRTLK